jgi:hypothetical protein
MENAIKIANTRLTTFQKIKFLNFYLLELLFSFMGIKNIYSKKFIIDNPFFQFSGKSFKQSNPISIVLYTDYIKINDSKVYYHQIHCFGITEKYFVIKIFGIFEDSKIKYPLFERESIYISFYFKDRKKLLNSLKSYLYYNILYK